MESRRKVVAALTIAGVALIVGGLAAVAIDFGTSNEGPSVSSRTGSPRPSASPSTMLSPIPTPTAGVSPSPSLSTAPSPSATTGRTSRPSGFTLVGTQLVYVTADGTSVPMPPIEGLSPRLVDGRALYYAVSPNRFGLRAGVRAGEFVPGVSIQQADGSSAQTGGVALVGSVVARMIADRVASATAPADRWTVALPVDITGAAKPVDVSFDSFGLHGWSDTPRVVVRFSGQMRVTDIIPSNGGYHVLVEGLGVTAWQVIDPTRLALPDTKLDLDHLMNELLIYGTGAPNFQSDVMVNRPVPLGRTMLVASDEVSVSLVVRESRADLGPGRILTVGDVPVFAASS